MSAYRGKVSAPDEDMDAYYEEYDNDMGIVDRRETTTRHFRQFGNDTESMVNVDVHQRRISASSDDSETPAQVPPTHIHLSPDHHSPPPSPTYDTLNKLKDKNEELAKAIEDRKKQLASKQTSKTKLEKSIQQEKRFQETSALRTNNETNPPVEGCPRCHDKEELLNAEKKREEDLKVRIDEAKKRVKALKDQTTKEEEKKKEAEDKMTNYEATLATINDAIALEVEEKEELEKEKKSWEPVLRVAVKADHVLQYRDATTRCNGCKKLVTLNDWYCCHDCDKYNLCSTCYEMNKHTHMKGTHSFTKMEEFERHFNLLLPHLCDAITQVGNYRCCVCKAVLYPTEKNAWNRCNECVNIDMCGRCFDNLNYKQHKGGTHTFTDMFTLLLTEHGFPNVENSSSESNTKANRQPFSCMSCGRENVPSVFRCKTCTSYDICQKCVITDAWRAHSKNPHNFTHVK